MIELWHCPDARSFRPLWALEELGLGYELHLLPFPPRVREPAYLEVNPLGTIPALKDGETFMTESAAIVQYLATRYGPSDLAVGVVASMAQILTNTDYRQFEPGKAEVVADDYAKWFLSRLRHVDRALQKGDWLCAGRFTAADISVGYALLLARQLKLDAKFSPAIQAYWERLAARPAFKAAKAAQKMDLSEALSS